MSADSSFRELRRRLEEARPLNDRSSPPTVATTKFVLTELLGSVIGSNVVMTPLLLIKPLYNPSDLFFRDSFEKRFDKRGTIDDSQPFAVQTCEFSCDFVLHEHDAGHV